MPSAPPSPVTVARSGIASEGAESTVDGRMAAAAVAALTLLGLVLRLLSLDQALFGDELFLYAIVVDHDAGEVLRAVHDTESTPPLHFLLAWATAKLGDPTIWVRAPSIAFGTATIPLVYLLGERTVGRAPALVASALVALSPFALFYSVEGRAYATLGFLSALSTLLLLRALERGGRGRWLAFGLCSCALLYTHYAGVFVVVAQGGWALAAHRARLRALLLTHAGVALAYLPWLPSFLVQRQDSAANRIEVLYPLTPSSVARGLLNLFLGQPFAPLRELPGRPLAALFCAGLAVAAAAVVAARVRGRRGLRRGETTTLVAVVGAATPLGAVLFSLGPSSVFLPRNLIPSLAALALLIGLLLARAGRRRLRPLLLAAVLVPVCAGAAMALDPDHRRPPYRTAAALIDERARPGDLVAESPAFALRRPSPLRRQLELHLERPRARFETHVRPRAAWEAARPGERVFAVGPVVQGHGAPSPPADLSGRFEEVERTRLAGTVALEVVAYARRGG